MRLLLDHPRLPACEICRRWLVDYDWREGTGSGEPRRWQSGPEEWRPLARRADQPTPCGICPKESPEKEREHVLTDANRQALAHWRQHKATAMKSLSEAEAADSVLRRNFALLESIFERAAVERQGEAAARAASRLLAALGR